MKQINLLPGSYRDHCRRRRKRTLACVAGAAAAFAVVLWAGLALVQINRLDARIVDLQVQLAPLRQQRSEMAQLQVQMTRAQELIDQYNQLSLPLPASALLDLLAERMPESVVLSSLSFAAPPVQLTASSGPGRSDSPTVSPMNITLHGFAESDILVAQFASNLGQCPAFEHVKLQHSREVRTDTRSVYEFHISFKVPADRPVVLVDKQEVAHAG